MRISFDFDPISEKVTNLEVHKSPAVKTVRASSTSKESGKIYMAGNSLKLTQKAMDLLNVQVGDKLILSFTNDEPALVTPKRAGTLKAGNKITKHLTIRCTGQPATTLAAYGNEWDFRLTGEGFLLLTNDTIDTPKEEMQQVLLDDSDFLSTVDNGEEIDFSFEITNKKK